MKKLVREILFLRRGERRALLVVCIFLVFSLVFRVVIPNIGLLEPEPDHAFLEQLELLKLKLDSLEKAGMRRPENPSASPRILRLRNFDPNTVSSKDLKAMHLPEKVISNLVRYREAGGVFHSPNDLKKIYSLDEQIYDAIKDYACIAAASTKDTTEALREVFTQHIPALIELNTADSSDLVGIKGIGPFSARTILRYRNLLGGYHKLSQLLEVYGMDSSRYELLCRRVYIDSSLIEPFDINILSFGELLRHPYISRQQVNDLISYRDFAKEIVSPDELKKFGIFDSTSYVKILPYIRCSIY